MKIIKYIFLLIWGVFSLFLYVDANYFSLQPADPISGRLRGCYTFFEMLIGVKEPSASIRSMQEYFSIVFILVGIILFLTFLITDIKKRKSRKALKRT